MESTAHDFKDNVDAALADPNLQDSLGQAEGRLLRAPPPGGRAPARVRGAARSRARHQEPHAWPTSISTSRSSSARCMALGGHVHWAPTAAEARGASSPSSAAAWAPGPSPSRSRWWPRRSALNEHLEALGIAPIETDLGEYIIQLRHEPPSHIIAPAVHLTKDQVADTFLEHHSKLGFTKRLTERNDLVAEARYVLRQKFLDADVGLTGANFLVAETGSSMLVTNEGNADLSNTLPRMHIVLASIEKVIPTLEDAAVLLRVLARSATGQEFVGLHHAQHRPEAAGRPRRAGALSRRHPRQRPLRGAGHRDAGHAALHPLRRLHEPLPGLWRDRRPCLWLGLSRPDRRGADAAAASASRRRPTCPTPRPSAAAARASARCASPCPS